MTRTLSVLSVPTGERLHDLRPALTAALAGDGPALLPVPAADPDRAAALAAALGAGGELPTAEDDPADPTALVVPTSGSAGPPSGVLLPVSALRASTAASADRLARLRQTAGAGEHLAAGAGGHWLLVLPAEHIAGLQVLLRSIRAGTEPVILDTARAFTAAGFAAAAARMPAGPAFTSLVPTQLRRLLADAGATAALATFTAVLVGGAAVPAGLVERARAAGATILPTYGTTETCGGCVYDGVPVDGAEVAIEPLPRSAIEPVDGAGRIVVSGAVVARGYRGRPGDPALTPGPPRRFRTADLGLLSAGRLTVLGRLDDVIVTGGTNVDPAAVERALAGAPGVGEAVVVGVPDAEWGAAVTAVVTPGPGDVPELAAMRARVTMELGSAAAPKHLLVLPDLPMIGPGKPDRLAIRELAIRALGPKR